MLNTETNFTRDLSVFQKVIYYILLGILFAIASLPFKVLYALSDFCYLLIYKVAKYRRKTVRKNLTSSFPDKSPEEILQIEKKFYHFFCDYVVETIKLLTLSLEDIKKRIKYSGLEHIHQSTDKGQCIALYLGHYCNWEWITSVGLFLHEGVLCGHVYHVLESKVMNALMLRIRACTGNESIPMATTLKRIVTITRKEKRTILIGFLSDQTPTFPNTHHWVNLLNHPQTLVITGTERVAKQCNFACVYFDITRPKRGYYNIEVIPITDTPKDYVNWEITEKYFHLLEKSIEREPAYWLWTHNRWKRDIEGLKEWRILYGNQSVESANAEIPTDTPQHTKITVITVAYNAKTALDKTMKSVGEQDYANIEYIVVDGGSTDGTPEMLSSYEGLLSKWISEKDGGIYDAMNKGISMATGDYCLFMNAGDTFMSPTTVSRVVRSNMTADVVYGYVMKNNKVKKALSPRNCHKMYYCHQCAFTRTTCLKEYPFDTHHAMSADFKQAKQLYLSGKIFQMLDYAISVFDTNGISNRKRSKGLWDNIKVIWETDNFLWKCRLLPRLLLTYSLCKIRGK